MSYTTRAIFLHKDPAAISLTPTKLDDKYCWFHVDTSAELIRIRIENVLILCGPACYRFWHSPFKAPLASLQNSPIWGCLLMRHAPEHGCSLKDLVSELPIGFLGAVSCGVDPPGMTPFLKYVYFCSVFVHLLNSCELDIFRPKRRWACLLEADGTGSSAEIELICGIYSDLAWRERLQLAFLDRIFATVKQIGEEAFLPLCAAIRCDFCADELATLFRLLLAQWPNMETRLDFSELMQLPENLKPQEIAGFGVVLQVIEPYQAISSHELTVFSGQQLYWGHGDLYGWRLCQNELGEEGWVPDFVFNTE